MDMDAVILYVDGNDPVWQKQYYSSTVSPIDPSRFRDWGTLPYLFRGIDKYMPFIENVFLVVSGESQVPSWIDREKVHIVYHRDIIPAEYLPTFNSCVIEMHIPYIEGLAEEFVYFNDDIFPVNECSPETFFKDGRPQVQLTELRLSELKGMYRMQCLNATNLAKAALGMREDNERYLYPPHWPNPLRKSLCLEILEKGKERLDNSYSVLRKNKNINQYIYQDYAYLKGEADNVKLPHLYLSPNAENVREAALAIATGEQRVVCVNDSSCPIADFQICRETVLKAFEEKLPCECKYEKAPEIDPTIIISMTSYPARIETVAGVWESILNQETDVPFRCVLTLAEPEFPGRKLPADLQALIDKGAIEVLWYPRNIRSFKKIVPVAKKYPKNAIITVDDDIIRPQGWLKTLIEDHKRHPKDIITNGFSYYFDSNLHYQRLTGFKQVAARGKNHIPGMIYTFCRFLSGSGTLFPAYTFTDKRFFDEKLFMTLSPTSDENWTYCFAVMADKVIRQTSVIYDESATNVPGSQALESSLFRVNRRNYDIIAENLFKTFTEFKRKIVERQRRVIVSLTSYPARFDVLPRVLESLTRQTFTPSRIVLTIAKNDVSALTDSIKDFIKKRKVELLVVEEDLKPHNKYYYTMRKYPDYAMITVDDDIIYANTMVESLMQGYWRHPDCIIARRVHKLERGIDGKILPYKQWVMTCRVLREPNEDLFATGVGGVLYPPNILNLDESCLEEIHKVLLADDIYLKALSQRKGIKTLYVPDTKDTPITDEKTQEKALYKENVWNDRNNEYVAIVGLK